MKLFEIIDKSHAEQVIWRNYSKSKGLFGLFKFEGKTFIIDLVYETISQLMAQYDLTDIYGLDLDMFKDKVIVRIDYCQLINGEKVYDNAHNLGHDAIKILSTVAIEVGKKLKEEKINIIYFAAKNHSDNSVNKRKSIYLKIGNMLARRLNMFCLVDNSPDVVLTFLCKGFSEEEIIEMKSKMQ